MMAEATDGRQLIFISYARADITSARLIEVTLSRAGYDARLQALDLRPGHDLVSALNPSDQEVAVVIALISANYVASGFGRTDWLNATLDKNKKIVPVLLDTTDVRYHLGPFECVNLADHSTRDWVPHFAQEISNILSQARPSADNFDTIRNRRRVSSSERDLTSWVDSAQTQAAGKPPLRNIPSRRGQLFAGRNELLQRLHESLRTGERITPQILVGSGGVGKSTLALEFARRHQAEYDVIWWIRGSVPSQISEDVSRLGAMLGIASERDRWSIASEKVRQWCEETDQKWLFVFDDVDDLDSVIASLPRRGPGHILITTRVRSSERPKFHQIPVDLLSEEEATEYLLQKTGNVDAEGARRIARASGGLALALELASDYIMTLGVTFAEYSKQLRIERKSVKSRVKTRLSRGRQLRRGDNGEQRKPSRIVVAMTSMSCKAAVELVPGSTNLLFNLCYMDSSPISQSVIRGVVPVDSDWRPLVQALGRLSLVELGADLDVVVNPLVREVSEELLSSEIRHQILESLLSFFDEQLPEDSCDPRYWSTCSQLVAHALAVAEKAESLEHKWAPTIATLYHRVGKYSLSRGDSRSASVMFRRAAHFASGSDKASRNTHYWLTLLNDLAVALAQEGQWSVAVEFSTEILERKVSERSSATSADEIVFVSNLAASLADSGHIREAAQILAGLTDAHSTLPKQIGPLTDALLSAYHNWASVLEDIGETQSSISIFRKVLSRKERVYGPNSAQLVDTLVGLVNVLCKVNNQEAALQLARRAYEIAEHSFGEYHRLTLATLDQLIQIATAEGNFDVALLLAERVHARRQDALGPEHPATVNALHNLASIRYRRGDAEAAVADLERVVMAHEKIHGSQHPKTIGAVRDLRIVRSTFKTEGIDKVEGYKDYLSDASVLHRRRKLFDGCLADLSPDASNVRDLSTSIPPPSPVGGLPQGDADLRT